VATGTCAVAMTARQLHVHLIEKPVDMRTGEHLKTEFLWNIPNHTIPTIVDNGFVLWEPRAIMRYLCNQYARDTTLYPKEPKRRAAVDRWLDFDITLNEVVKDLILAKEVIPGKFPIEEKMIEYKKLMRVFDRMVAEKHYITGEHLTIADLTLMATIHKIHVFRFEVNEFQNVWRWFSTLRTELPYFDEINDYTKEEVKEVMEKVLMKEKDMFEPTEYRSMEYRPTEYQREYSRPTEYRPTEYSYQREYTY
jgi:glutathione S-transferase